MDNYYDLLKKKKDKRIECNINIIYSIKNN